MGLETATYISDLVVTNPAAGDPVSQGDDHLRLVKTVLQTQFPDSSNGPVYGLRAASVQATTSGTSIDFTSIPSWVKRITLMLTAVSTNGSSPLVVQIGDSGGVETSGYNGSYDVILNAAATQAGNFSASFAIGPSSAAASVHHGTVVLTLLDSSNNIWAASMNVGLSNTAATIHGAGTKSLSATLDRVRLTTAGGSDTFDAGSANILYE